MRHSRGSLLLCVGALVAASGAAGQERGSIAGHVLDRATGQPLASAQVTVAGTNLGTLTNRQGRYLIVGVPAGVREVRVTLIGYASGSRSVGVVAGERASVDFRLAASAVPIEGVVATATGEVRRRREIGNALGIIEVAREVEPAPINTMSDVLQGRVAGVTVMRSSGSTGTGARVRIRGSNSVSLANEPLVIVDGIRVNGATQSSSIHVGGQSPSRFEDLNPDEIESIEILKGPAAAAAYGTAAANGVVQITTRRGRAGPSQWSFYSEHGTVQDRNDWPGNYRQRGTATVTGEFRDCLVFQAAVGECTPVRDSLLVWNPLQDRRGGHGVSRPELGPASPLRDGFRRKHGVSVAGGGDAATYFVSGEHEDEQGVYEPNRLRRVFLRANVTGHPAANLDLAVSSGFLHSRLGMPQNDDNVLGFLSSSLLAGYRDDPETRGYYTGLTPDALFQQEVGQEVQRYTASLTTTYRPRDFLRLTGQAGLDLVHRHDEHFVPPDRIFYGSLPEGHRASNHARIGTYTANLSATAQFSPRPTLTSTSTAGLQYSRETQHRTDASGWGLLEGTRSLQGANSRFAVNESWMDNILIGGLVSQQLGWRDRLFLTATLRGDDNSAFGQDLGFVYYPAASVSWVAGEEPWFPRGWLLSALRLRAAVGTSGLRPGFRDALTYYAPVAVALEHGDVPGFTIRGTGNPGLRPERSREYELGLDAGLLGERLALALTYYDKRSRDALVARTLPPSLGEAVTQFVNVGEVSNRGVEAELHAQLLDLRWLRWEATLIGSTNRNRLLTLGEGIEPILLGARRHHPGYPLGGYWTRPILWEDRDGNGLISPDEVRIVPEPEYRGPLHPTRQASLTTTLRMFELVGVSALLEYHGGHLQANATEWFRCLSRMTCRALNDPHTPVADQARAVAARFHANFDTALEDASFVKLRELAVTLAAPDVLTRRGRLRTASLTLSARNLRTWTGYRGLDPEVSTSGQANFASVEYLTQPQVRYFTARLTLGL